MNLSLVLGILGELIPLFAGLLCIVYFGGYKKPKFKDEAQRKHFEKYREKHGKKLTWLGYFLILFSLASVIRFIIKK